MGSVAERSKPRPSGRGLRARVVAVAHRPSDSIDNRRAAAFRCERPLIIFRIPVDLVGRENVRTPRYAGFSWIAPDFRAAPSRRHVRNRDRGVPRAPGFEKARSPRCCIASCADGQSRIRFESGLGAIASEALAKKEYVPARSEFDFDVPARLHSRDP
jgi:hypothetical protein